MRKGKTLLLGSVCVLLALFRAPAVKAVEVEFTSVVGKSVAAAVPASALPHSCKTHCGFHATSHRCPSGSWK